MTKLSGFLFPNHIYGNNKLGTEESVKALTAKDVKKYWDVQKEQRVVISIAGDFDREEVLAALQNLPEPRPQALNVSAPAWTSEKSFSNIVEGRNQDLTMLIFPTVSLYHEDAPALEILSSALDGFNGILYQELREKRNLGYSAFPLLSQSEHTGFLAYGIIASPEHRKTIQEQFAEITKTLQKNGIDKTAFERAKASVQMEFINNRQSAKSRASSAANAVLFGRNPDYSQEYLEKMLAVSLDDVNACIKKYLVLEQAYTAHSGSK
jgi:zinc protease